MEPSEVDIELFRAEVRCWLEEYCPESMQGDSSIEPVWGGRKQQEEHPIARQWLSLMLEKGWTVPTWPKEYGGAGLSSAEARVLAQEMRRIGAKPALASPNLGIIMLGPVLLKFAGEELKKRFLPAIASGGIRFCQGFSEPEAGSDLASVRTRALLEGDSYRVKGHKIWSSFAHVADWMFCLARTDPDAEKHQGLSLLLIDLLTPNIEASPIQLITGEALFCEVFIDDVLVPENQRVGDEGDGWKLAMSILQHERTGIFAAEASARQVRKPSLRDMARERIGMDQGRLADIVLRERLVRHTAILRAVKATQRRVKDERRGDIVSASLLKLITSETFQQRNSLIVDIYGLDGLIWDGDDLGGKDPAIARSWLRSRGNTIEGGTSEIQMNIIAKHGLGLIDSRSLK